MTHLSEPGHDPGQTIVTNEKTGGKKGRKVQRYSLIPHAPLNDLAALYGRGAELYGDNNWRKGYEWSASYDAAQRHLNTFWQGEDIDEGTGSPHLICAAFHLFALAHFSGSDSQSIYHELDDRPRDPEPELSFNNDKYEDRVDLDDEELNHLLDDLPLRYCAFATDTAIGDGSKFTGDQFLIDGQWTPAFIYSGDITEYSHFKEWMLQYYPKVSLSRHQTLNYTKVESKNLMVEIFPGDVVIASNIKTYPVAVPLEEFGELLYESNNKS